MKRLGATLLLAMIICLAAGALAPAASPGFRTRSGNDLYCTAREKVLTGRQVIGGRTYYFDKNGKQFHGWKKIDGAYYFFALGRKEKGYLQKRGTPNGFSLTDKGKAILKTEGEKKRMKAMAYVSSLLHQKTKSSWSRKKKLKAMYDFACTLPYLYDDTDKTAAECVLKFKKQVDGDCADTNSFLAFAGSLLGYKSSVENDFGHWWALVDGKVCDSNYQLFLCPLKKAISSFPYNGVRQSIAVDSPHAGSLLMTIHPEVYGYDVNTLSIYKAP